MSFRLYRRSGIISNKVSWHSSSTSSLKPRFNHYPTNQLLMSDHMGQRLAPNFFVPFRTIRLIMTAFARFSPPSSSSLGSSFSQGGADSANLEKLALCNEISLVQTEFNLEESGYNTRKAYKYEIKGTQGGKLFNAVQTYETYPPRFDLKLFGPNGDLLVTHKLLQNLSSHLLSMQIIRPGGLYIGSIEERLDINADKPPMFELRDSRDNIQALVLTDFSKTKYGFRRSIKILTPDQSKTIGKISKKWAGFSDKLVVNVSLPKPADMNVEFRASLIGLCILLVIATLQDMIDTMNFTLKVPLNFKTTHAITSFGIS